MKSPGSTAGTRRTALWQTSAKCELIAVFAALGLLACVGIVESPAPDFDWPRKMDAVWVALDPDVPESGGGMEHPRFVEGELTAEAMSEHFEHWQRAGVDALMLMFGPDRRWPSTSWLRLIRRNAHDRGMLVLAWVPASRAPDPTVAGIHGGRLLGGLDPSWELATFAARASVEFDGVILEVVPPRFAGSTAIPGATVSPSPYDGSRASGIMADGSGVVLDDVGTLHVMAARIREHDPDGLLGVHLRVPAARVDYAGGFTLESLDAYAAECARAWKRLGIVDFLILDELRPWGELVAVWEDASSFQHRE